MPKNAEKKITPKIESLHGNLLYCREDATSLGLYVEAHLIDAALAGLEQQLALRSREEKAQPKAA